jgi:hypothetical protein
MTQTEVAKAKQVSTRTIIRLEQKIGAQIERVSKQHQSFVRLRPSSDNIAAVSELEIIASDVCNAENNDPPALYKHTSLSEETEVTNSAPDASDLSHLETASPPLTSPALVCEAFDVLAADGMRLSVSRVRRYVEANAGRPIHAATIARLYARERDDRAWQREVAKLATLPIGKLNALDRRAQRVLGEGPGAKTYRWVSAIYPHIAAELDRRAEMKERLRTGPKRSRTVEQALLLAEVEDQIAEYRASTRRRKGPIVQAARPARESVPVQLTPDMPLAPIVAPEGALAVIDPMATIARLKAQRDARQATAS